jgi:hypothetical protein
MPEFGRTVKYNREGVGSVAHALNAWPKKMDTKVGSVYTP